MLKKILLTMVCICVANCSGCYDNNEIDSIATVMAVGVELHPATGNRLYTFAVSNTGETSSSSGDESGLICYSQQGKNIADAIDTLDRKISKKISFSHMSAILFSEECGAEGMEGEASFFQKDSKVRPRVMVALTSVSPSVYLSRLNPRLEPNAEKYFQKIFESNRTYVSAMTLQDLITTIHCDTTELVPVISSSVTGGTVTEKDAFVTYSGVVASGRYVSRLPNSSFAGLLFSDKKIKVDGVSVRSIKKPEIKVSFSKNKLKIKIDMFAYATPGFNKAAFEKSAEKELKELCKNNYDLINAVYIARKNFLTYNQWKSKSVKSLLKNARYDVNIDVTEKGDI